MDLSSRADSLEAAAPGETGQRLGKPAGHGRRRFLKAMVAGAGAGAGAGAAGRNVSRAQEAGVAPDGKYGQSIVHWCYRPLTVEEAAIMGARLGYRSVELVGPEHWEMLRSHGMTCAIAGSHGFAKGFAHLEEHAECLDILGRRIDECADAGVPSVITFSGFGRGIDREEGIRNMVDGLKKIAGKAEAKGVTVCLEMLNSAVDENMKGHPDYFCDDIDMTVDICRQVGSDRVKVLFDIYHVQIMHGDIIRRLTRHQDFIGHYHTAGNPGRNEIGDDQEINYPGIMKAIAATGYAGFVGQEFIPTRDDIEATLREAFVLCSV